MIKIKHFIKKNKNNDVIIFYCLVWDRFRLAILLRPMMQNKHLQRTG